MTNRLAGNVAIITGANQGLGLEIAEKYVAEGASVLLCARNSELLIGAKNKLSNRLTGNQFVEIVTADVSQVDDVDRIVAKVMERCGKVDILVNNAAILGPIGSVEEIDWQDWLEVLQINLLGSVLMARAVLPVMKKQKKGKIIQLSGGGATAPRPFVSAYAISKVGIVRFSETLAKEVEAFGIDVNAISPGALNTRMLDEVLEAGPQAIGETEYVGYLKQKETGGTRLELAANLAVFLASSESDGITGRLISAVWDTWEKWPHHLDELMKSDVYTLRRITGRDRGFQWGDK